MKILDTINSWIERAETVLLVVILSVMVLLSFLQVLLRNFFEQGILWGDILLRNLVLWVGFLGASLATRESKHINIDLFTRFLSGGWKEFAQLITNLFASFVCVLLADAGWTFVMDEKLYETKIFAEIPAWYFQTIIPVGFILIAFRFFVLALNRIIPMFLKRQDDK
jgi:TRAP-type C4-dicarboxylate transport system permease small subunit